MDLEESCLLIRTSRRRSLALILLYSLYSSSIGTRSSFWTFLHQRRETGEYVLFSCPDTLLTANIDMLYLGKMNL